jgi:two-component system cell cycle sensor histidine kinase/response regulator CckA
MPDRSLHVLLVDDDDEYGAFVGRELASAPVTLQRVVSIESACRALETQRFDAILLDLGLPDSDGLATVEAMGAAAHDVPIVVLTSELDEASAVQSVQRGADDYLSKDTTNGLLIMRSLRYSLERAALRRRLRHSEEQLRQAQKMEAVGRLAGGVAHDFNNVLTAIFGYSDLLLEEFTLDDPRRADVQEIRRSAERAAALTRQLLAFSRKQVMQPRLLNLNDVIGNVQDLLRRLVGEDIQIQMDLQKELTAVMADSGQIEQVLMNLAANARDAMPEGGRLDISTANVHVESDNGDRPGLKPGHYALLSVHDTGTGMPDHVRAHIFEPFFTTKEQGKGTGLGLATVYGIVKQTGGGVYAESGEGQGTTFAIYLPVPPAEITSFP